MNTEVSRIENLKKLIFRKKCFDNRIIRPALNANGDPGITLSDEERLWEQLSKVDEFLSELLRRDDEKEFALRTIVNQRTKVTRTTVAKSRFAEKFSDLDPYFLNGFRRIVGGARYRPRVEAFIQFTIEYGLQHSMDLSWAVSKESARAYVEYMNRYMKDLKTLITSASVQRRERVWRCALDKNIASVQNYLDAIREVTAMKVLRLSFGYRHGVGMKVDPNRDYGTERGVGAKELNHDRDRLLRMISRRYKSELLGYIWRTDFSKEQGFCLHLHVFVRAHQSEPDAILGANIGCLWVEEVNHGWGTFVCFNSQQALYDDTTIGYFERSNDGKAKRLLLAISRELELDARVRPKVFEGYRCFGRGISPRGVTPSPAFFGHGHGALTPFDVAKHVSVELKNSAYQMSGLKNGSRSFSPLRSNSLST